MVPGAVAQVNNQYLLNIIPIARSMCDEAIQNSVDKRLLRFARNDTAKACHSR